MMRNSEDTETHVIPVKGISHYQEAARKCVEGQPVELICEPQNRFDKYAVRIDFDNRHIGYVPKELAFRYTNAFKESRITGKVVSIIGSGSSGYNLGVRVEITITPPPQDFTTFSQQQLEQLAIDDCSEAMYELACRYSNTSSNSIHSQEARVWFRKAAELGHAQAMTALSDCYATGQCGFPQSTPLAIEWCQKAANAGDPEAMRNLGGALFVGQLLALDRATGRMWLDRAADAGDAESLICAALFKLSETNAPQPCAASKALVSRAASMQNFMGEALLAGEITQKAFDTSHTAWAVVEAIGIDVDNLFLLDWT